MTRLAKGVQVTLATGQKVVLEDDYPNWLASVGVLKGEPFILDAYFQVSHDDVYQFQVNSAAGSVSSLTVDVDDHSLNVDAGKGWSFHPVSLSAGFHKLQVRGKAGGDPQLEIRLGGPGSRSIFSKHGAFQHLPTAGEKLYSPNTPKG